MVKLQHFHCNDMNAYHLPEPEILGDRMNLTKEVNTTAYTPCRRNILVLPLACQSL
jgi:hypothetical protein